MGDIHIRVEGHAGRITLQRPKALNAMSYDMCLAIEKAVDAWAVDDAVKLVVIDAEGDKAFCAGGDIQDMYDTASAGDFNYGRTFWRDEYRLNAKIFNYPKPYVAFMQGFTMGGGVGISCHGSHRIVCENSQIAMPECGIGLVPDVGGTLMLARAPGRLGEYLGMTGARMDAGNAIYAGFADSYIPREAWAQVISELEETGDIGALSHHSTPAPDASYKSLRDLIDRHFASDWIGDVLASLGTETHDFGADTLKMLGKKSPISVACTPEIVRRVRQSDTIETALVEEFNFTYRSAEFGDFVEGIRATIIERGHVPEWTIPDLASVTREDVDKMLAPLGANALKL